MSLSEEKIVVVIEFSANEEGKIDRVSVLEGAGDSYDQEAIRVVQSIPEWKVEYSHGEFRRVPYTVAVVFDNEMKRKYAPPFQIYIDTVYLKLKDYVKPATHVRLTHAVKYDNKYYCVFEENTMYYSWLGTKHFFIILPNGSIEQTIALPDEIMNSSYFDLFVHNNTVFLKDYYSHQTYFLDMNKLTWRKTREADDVIYADDDYSVTYLDFGEWGQIAWFKNKKTGKEYTLPSEGKIINKIDSTYYITHNQKIRKIEAPAKMCPAATGCYYNAVKKNNKKYYKGVTSFQGTELVYGNDIPYYQYYYDNEPRPFIATSFSYKNQLYHIYVDTNSTYITKLENGEMIPLQAVGGFYDIFNCYYSYRRKIQKDNSQLLKFRTQDENLFGFIEIKDDTINIRYIRHDIDSMKYLGSDSFSAFLDFVDTFIDSLPLSWVDSLEKSIGGTDMKIFSKGILHESYYPNKSKIDCEGSEKYLKTIDALVANLTEYYFTTKDSLVKVIFLKWIKTKPYTWDNKFRLSGNTEEEINAFQKKYEELEQIITQKLGITSKKKLMPNNRFEQLWESPDGLNVNLYASDFKERLEIRMVIYKE